MKRNIIKTYIYALLFFILFIELLSNNIFSQSEIYAYPIINQIITPGEEAVPITISLLYIGEQPLYDVNISTINYYPFYLYPWYNSGQIIYLPQWQPGQVINVTFLMDIAPNATDGTYSFPIYIYSLGQNFVVNATIPITGYVNFNINGFFGTPNNPIEVSPGEDNVPLTIVIINTGNSIITNASIYLQSQYPIQFLQNYINIGNIPIGQPIEITTYVNIYQNATEGIYNIPININYYYNSSQIVNLTLDINGYNQLYISSIFGSLNNPIEVSPGEDNVPLTFIIRNMGTSQLLNTSLYILPNNIFTTNQNYISIGIVPVGGYNYNTINVNINPNISPGNYYIPVIVYYYNSSSELYNVPITIYPPNITANLYTNPSAIFQGYNYVEFDLYILNYGEAPAENSYIYVESPFELLSQNNISLGVIPVGVPMNVTFILSIPDNITPGQYYFNVTIYYDGGYYQKSFLINVYPKGNIEILNVYYNNLNPGSSEVPITIEIKNNSSVEIKNLYTYIGSSNVIQPYVSSSNPLGALTASQIFIGDLYPNQILNFTIIVDIDNNVQPGYYILPLIFIWNQTESIYPFEESVDIDLYVSNPYYITFIENYWYVIFTPLIIAVIIIILKRNKIIKLKK